MIVTPKWKRNIAVFMTGQGISLFGSSLVHYAVMWHITLSTQSGIMMTVIAIAGILPIFLISPIAGVWADRYNKKHIINISDAAIAVVTLIMAVLFSIGKGMVWLLLICLIARAFGQGIQMPTVNAIIPELVPEAHLTRVNGINSSIQSMMTFASPMLGGVLLAVAPIQTLMYIDVVTAAIGICLVLLFVKTSAHAPSQGKGNGIIQFYSELREGLGYISTRLYLRKCLILGLLINVMIGPAAMLTPLQVARNWGDDVWNVFGKLSFGAEHRLATIEVGFSAGMMIGGLAIGVWGGFRNKNRTFALFTMLLGITSAALGIFENFWVYLVFMGLSGVFLSMRSAPMQAMMQANIDSVYRGRVMSIQLMVGTLSNILGMLAWGPLSDLAAIEWLLIGTGAFILLLGNWIMFDKTLLKAGMISNATEIIENN